MKYKILTPEQQETYNIGYKVGNRQIVITDIEWEDDEEHKIYRKGYMAGLMDYKRNISNVSNVSNVEIETPITSTTPISISKGNSKYKDNKGGMGGKKVFTPPTIEQVLEFTKERQCTEQTGRKFYDYYTTQDWKDSSGKPVRNWKGKYIAVWDKPENKNPSATFTAWKDCKF
jgi:uncharacterized protein YvpB